jgi:ketosteroid isomerase-like protein
MKLTRVLKLTVAIAIIAAMFLRMPNARAITQSASEFKNLTEANIAAWNDRSPEALSKFYAKDADLVFYDALPLQYKSWSAYQTGIQKNIFDKMPLFKLAANDDLRVTRKGDIAWTTFTWHFSAKLEDGTPLESDGRQTDIWEQRNGTWLIVHEHISEPVSP